MGSPRWAHQLGLYPKVLVMKETSQKLFNTIQPQVSISGNTTEQLGSGK